MWSFSQGWQTCQAQGKTCHMVQIQTVQTVPRRVQLKSFPTNVSKPYTTWLVSRTCKWSSMFLMTRTYLFESFDIFLIASNLIKSEELAWPLWPVYFRDILNHPFSRHVPKKLLPTTGYDCSEMCHFDFKGHMCQCALQRCDNSPVLRMRSFMNLHLWWLEHARRWHSVYIIIIYI